MKFVEGLDNVFTANVTTDSCTAESLSKAPPPVLWWDTILQHWTAPDTSPSQERFTRSASINHHKLWVLITTGNRDVLLVWGDTGKTTHLVIVLLFSVFPTSVGSSHPNNKSIFVFDKDSQLLLSNSPSLVMKTWSCTGLMVWCVTNLKCTCLYGLMQLGINVSPVSRLLNPPD